MKFRYRKWFGESRDSIVNAVADAYKRGDSATGNGLSAKAIADHIESWDIHEDEVRKNNSITPRKAVTVTCENVQRLEPNCADRLFRIIVICSDVSDSEINPDRNNSHSVDIESQFRAIVDKTTPEAATVKN